MKPITRYELGNFLSLRIIDAAQEVHRHIGPGYPIERYRRAIGTELRRQLLEVQDRFPVDIWQSRELAALYFLDMFVEWQVIVAVRTDRRAFLSEEREQMAACLEATGASLGILFNFGRPRLEFERVFPG
jgi:GxxExxY protein